MGNAKIAFSTLAFPDASLAAAVSLGQASRGHRGIVLPTAHSLNEITGDEVRCIGSDNLAKGEPMHDIAWHHLLSVGEPGHPDPVRGIKREHSRPHENFALAG